MKRWTRIAAETSGAEIAETALVLPIAFLILLGIFWFGRAYNIYATITHAAREGARVAAVASCADCGNTLLTADEVGNRVSEVLQASKLDPGKIAAYTISPAPTFCANITPPGGCVPASNNITVCRGVRLNASGSSLPACGALVSFQYRFDFPFRFLNRQFINLPAAAEMQMEY